MIATKVGDIPEIVRHRENGLLIEPGDTQALASAILAFISDPELAAHCAANGLRYATENFSFDKMMDAKLRADLAVLRKKQGCESASRSSKDIASTGNN